MADPEHLEILKKGEEEWNRWRGENPKFRPDLRRADLAKVNLLGADLREADLREADLKEANLSVSDFSNADLSDASLRAAKLTRAYLSVADLSGADLKGADLSGASLPDAGLRRADLRGADLSGADLARADLIKADLANADLSGADLSDANLNEANLFRARLSDASLTSADLSGTDLSYADLRRAVLRLSELWDTHFHGLNLRETFGLKAATHHAPSSISSQTLELSSGQIPDVFLKGCGLRDWEILAAKLHDPDLRQDEIIDLTYKIAEVRGSSPISPLSVFLSYSHIDADFVDLLYNRLDDDGIRSWRDRHDLVAGPIEAQVDRAINLQSAVLLVLSEHSVESDWVQWEAERARKAAKEKKAHILCPVTLDDAWKDCAWPGRLRTQIEEYLVLDLSEWKDEAAFETQYQKLKKGLGIYYREEGE